MGVLLGFILIFMAGIAAVIFSLLAYRLKQDIFFILGCVFTSIVVIYIAFNFQWWWFMINSGEGAFFALLIASMVVVPVIFLIQTKTKPSMNPDSEVTDDFLTSVINEEEEEINFDEEYEIDDKDFDNL